MQTKDKRLRHVLSAIIFIVNIRSFVLQDILSKEQKQIWKKITFCHHLNIHSSSLIFLYLMMTVLSLIIRYYSSWSLFLFSIDYLWDNCSLQHPRNFLFNTWTLFLCGMSKWTHEFSPSDKYFHIKIIFSQSEKIEVSMVEFCKS